MDTEMMDGTSLAASILDDTGGRAKDLAVRLGRRPCLATVLVGDDPASATYVRMKQSRCRTVGIDSRHVALPESSSTADAVTAVEALSSDASVDGILVQHPVPAQVDEHALFEAITPGKDVDGVTFSSFASMALGGGVGFESCTPGGIVRLLDHYEVELEGAHAVVIGRSPILGKPAGMLLLARNASVTYCHSKTRDLPGRGRCRHRHRSRRHPELRPRKLAKPGSVIIDAGYNPGNVGDVATDEALGVAALITPVPGGIGPMTIATLLAQTVDAAAAAAP